MARSKEALASGNDGKARVCARRACGVALREWYGTRGRAGVPADAQSLLRLAAEDGAVPAPAREAAARLSASVAASRPGTQSAPDGTSTGPLPAPRASTDPAGDAAALIGAIVAPDRPGEGPATGDRDV